MAYKLGKAPARKIDNLHFIEHYLGYDVLPHSPNLYSPPNFTNWGMLGNDSLGDCTIAGVAHLLMANAVQNSQPVPNISTNMVEHSYFWLTGGEDTGLDEVTVLQHGLHHGFWDIYKFAGIAPTKLDQNSLQFTVANFGAAYLGVQLPAPAQNQFPGTWDLTGTSQDDNIEGGHCIVAVGYDSQYLYVVTWGQVIRATWRWANKYLDESWAVISPEDSQVDLVSLQKDLKLLA